MPDSPVFMRVKALCDGKGIKITSLITEITGSAGNAPTWKKGNIRSDYLAAISSKFGVTADYLLTGEEADPTKKEPAPRDGLAQDIAKILIEQGVISEDAPLSDQERKDLLDCFDVAIHAFKKLKQ